MREKRGKPATVMQKKRDLSAKKVPFSIYCCTVDVVALILWLL